MNRLKFMHKLRVKTYLSPKSRPKVDKDARKFVQLLFVVEMTVPIALACDPVIQRAFEDCEDIERNIQKVVLRSEVVNTDVTVYDLEDSKLPSFVLENVTIEGLGCERKEGITYLYFSIEVPQSRKGFWEWYGGAYNHSLYLEFTRSQFAFEGPRRDGEEDADKAALLGAVAELAAPVREGSGITSMSIEVPGQEPVVIDQKVAEQIRAAAAQAHGGAN